MLCLIYRSVSADNNSIYSIKVTMVKSYFRTLLGAGICARCYSEIDNLLKYSAGSIEITELNLFPKSLLVAGFDFGILVDLSGLF